MSDPASFQIFKSSAGSGKTFTLVKEYFKIILENPERFKHTLAITFTNKSTAEMKSRILETAHNIACGKENDIFKKVLEDKPHLKNHTSEAKHILKKILHSYPQFSISTIDSFFSRVIRSLAYETGIPMQFEIELNSDQIIDAICAELYMDIKDNTALRDWLIQFANYTMEQDKGWNLDKELKLTSKELFKDQYRVIQNERNKNDKDFINELKKLIYTADNKGAGIGKTFFDLCSKNHIDLNDFHYKKGGFLVKFFEYLNNKTFKTPNKSIINFYGNDTAWGRIKSSGEDLINSFSTEFNSLLSEGMDFYHTTYKDLKTAQAILSNYYASAILHQLDDKYSNYRESNQVLTIGDYMQSLSNLIAKDDTPFIYEKVGNKYHHIMVDEFQDTSQIQWNNIRPLLINSLSQGYSSLVVGDAKQSIYRWRGGNMQLLVNKITEELVAFKSMIKDKPLRTNYRSNKDIVEFNNSFFHEAKEVLMQFKKDEFLQDDLDLFELVYEEKSLKQTVNKKEAGFVELKLFDEDNFPDNYDKSLELDEFNLFKNQALQYSLNTLNNALANGYEYKDICILVRSKNEIERLTHFLLNNGIKEIVSADSLFIDEAPSVALLLHSLKYLLHPEDDIAISNIIYHLHSVKQNENDYNWNTITPFTDHLEQHIENNLKEQLHTLKNLPLLNLVESLCKLFNINVVSDQYTSKFIDIVLSYSKKPESNLNDFLNWYINNDSPSLSNAENQNAIQIMTIHKSKGLQFPVVIIPFANWDFKKTGKSPTKWLSTNQKSFKKFKHQIISVSSGALETHFENDIKHENALICIDNLNLLYVAFTRAQEKLFIATELHKADKINSTQSLINAVANSKKIDLVSGKNSKKHKDSATSKKPNSINYPTPVSITNYATLNWETNYSLSIKDLQKKSNFGSEEIKFGNKIHNRLADVKSEKELIYLVQELKNSESIDNPLFSALVNGLEQILKDNITKDWFSDNWTVKNEKSILDKEGNLYRPDRVIYTETECLVIDYKTGAQVDSHRKQVNQYVQFLKTMGYKNVKGFILYLSPYLVDKL